MPRQTGALYVELGRFWSGQLATMKRELPAVIDGADIEALHRLRVAVRRTRSLLKLFAPLMPAGQWDVDALYAEFGWFGQISGAVRDLDVLLIAVQERGEPALRPLVVQLTRQRATASRTLRTALRSNRLRELLANWEVFVAALPQCKAPPPAARVGLRHLFAVQLLKQALWLLRHGSRIGAKSEAAELHRLRIRAKRLRYLIEVFAGLLPVNDQRVLRRRLIALQDLLGAHQDAVATTLRLHSERASMAAVGVMTPKVERELQAWLLDLRQVQQQVRAELPAVLRRFANSCDRL